MNCGDEAHPNVLATFLNYVKLWYNVLNLLRKRIGYIMSTVQCEDCGKTIIRRVGRVCATCADKRQGRPSIVKERRQVAIYRGVKVARLPGLWQKFQAQVGDDPCYKIDYSGRMFDKETGKGRVMFYAHEVVKPGSVVDIRHMVAVHLVKMLDGKTVHIKSDEGETVEQVREYLVFLPTKEEQSSRLTFAYTNIPSQVLSYPVALFKQEITGGTVSAVVGIFNGNGKIKVLQNGIEYGEY